jgi:antagonist of KipI
LEAFLVRIPGPYSTLQDKGRFGYQSMGVPVSGALDPFASLAANLLVGNPGTLAVLEVTYLGPELQVLNEADIAVTGARMQLTVNGKTAPGWTSLRVKKGDLVRFGHAVTGCRAYLAVTGGFDVPKVMGSRSTYVSARLGGVDGRPLKGGDLLLRGEGSLLPRERRLESPPEYSSRIDLRAVPGPQEDYFSGAVDLFFGSLFTVTDKANRMGYRLQGPFIERDERAPKSIISEPSVPGNVQIPPDGQSIILLVEQTIGGYTKIATVCTPDLSRIAQAKPGDRIRFRRVSLQEAHDLYRAWRKELADIQNFFSGFQEP